MCPEALKVIIAISKIIKTYLINLHKLWITWCKLIYTKLANRLEIEERVNLMNKVKSILKLDRTEVL